MEDCDTRTLSCAKEEFTQVLISTLTKHFYDGFDSIFDEATERSEGDPNEIFTTFQDILKEVPKWSADMVERETNRIIECSECEYLEDLITAVFISHTKILASIRVNKKNKKINLKIPKLDYFIHKCYVSMAREFWRVPYYFNRNTSNIEIQKHIKLSEELIAKSIGDTIRKLLPFKHILRESLGDDYEDDDSEDSEDIGSSANTKPSVNFKEPSEETKKIIKKELEDLQGGTSSSSIENIIKPFVSLQEQETEINKDINEIDMSNIENFINDNVDEEKKIKELEQIKKEDEEAKRILLEAEALAQEKEMAEKKKIAQETKVKEQQLIDANRIEEETKAKEQQLIEVNRIAKEKKFMDEARRIKEAEKSIEDDGMNELDLDSVHTDDRILKVDDEFNAINLETLNDEVNIKTAVMQDFQNKNDQLAIKEQPKKDWTFFDDAPEVETI
jgi:hypothetical protein